MHTLTAFHSPLYLHIPRISPSTYSVYGLRSTQYRRVPVWSAWCVSVSRTPPGLLEWERDDRGGSRIKVNELRDQFRDLRWSPVSYEMILLHSLHLDYVKSNDTKRLVLLIVSLGQSLCQSDTPVQHIWTNAYHDNLSWIFMCEHQVKFPLDQQFGHY